jgi:hypothetical protein
MMQHVCRWRPGRRLVLVVEDRFAAVSLALACVTRQVTMISRQRWDAALYYPPGPQPKGKRDRKPTKGKRQRGWQDWAERSETPWATLAVDGHGGQRNTLWGFLAYRLGVDAGLAPRRDPRWDGGGSRGPTVEIRDGMVADPEGQLRMEALFCPDVQATPVEILPWVVRRWSV